MKRGLLVIAGVLLASLTTAVLNGSASGVSAQGQSSVNMLAVDAGPRKCVVTTTPMDFGRYDAASANAVAPLDAQATITVACTKGAVVNISIDNGTSGTAGVRRMIGGASSYLTYELFQDIAHAMRWGTTANDGYPGGVAPSRDPRPFTVYGRVTGGQDVAEGAYQDTVVVTVNF
jgi:spore coat protein U-like protein